MWALRNDVASRLNTFQWFNNHNHPQSNHKCFRILQFFPAKQKHVFNISKWHRLCPQEAAVPNAANAENVVGAQPSTCPIRAPGAATLLATKACQDLYRLCVFVCIWCCLSLDNHVYTSWYHLLTIRHIVSDSSPVSFQFSKTLQEQKLSKLKISKWNFLLGISLEFSCVFSWITHQCIF